MKPTPSQSCKDRDLLTVAEFCEPLVIKQSTARKWILERRVAVVKISRRLVRIPRSELDRIVTEGFRCPPRSVKGESGKPLAHKEDSGPLFFPSLFFFLYWRNRVGGVQGEGYRQQRT